MGEAVIIEIRSQTSSHVKIQNAHQSNLQIRLSLFQSQYQPSGRLRDANTVTMATEISALSKSLKNMGRIQTSIFILSMYYYCVIATYQR